MSLRQRRGDRGLPQSSSSRRLSSIVNPDVLHDVSFHITEDMFISREAPARRHSVAPLGPSISTRGITREQLSPRARSVSEKIHISKADQKALLEKWKENERLQRRKLDELIEEEEEDEQAAGSVSQVTRWHQFLLVFGLFSAHLLSSVGLQKLNSLRPGCGQLVTLLQYLATIAEKSPQARNHLSSPVLPMHWHASFVLLMFLSVQMGNASLGVGLPFGLFLVIKNTNLAWSLLLGLGTGRAFTASQIISIGAVTAGISICVLAQNQESGKDVDEMEERSDVLFGALLCAASTFCVAALGSLQEVIFARYKDGSEVVGESLFFTHLLGLPLFLVGSGLNSMRNDLSHLFKTPTTTVSMLLLNIISTMFVKQCFVQLLEEGQSVTGTLTIAVARMTGVILSEIMASRGTTFASLNFWMGALLIAAGSISYANGGRLPCRRAA